MLPNKPWVRWAGAVFLFAFILVAVGGSAITVQKCIELYGPGNYTVAMEDGDIVCQPGPGQFYESKLHRAGAAIGLMLLSFFLGWIAATAWHDIDLENWRDLT